MIDGAIAFKDDNVKREFELIPLMLQFVCQDFVDLCNQYKITPVLTRVLERIDGDSGVHEVHRAVDFRDEHEEGYTFSPGQAQHITDFLNAKYRRNDGKPTCLFHSFDLGPLHVHLQIAESNMTYCPDMEPAP